MLEQAHDMLRKMKQLPHEGLNPGAHLPLVVRQAAILYNKVHVLGRPGEGMDKIRET